jgi:hypothetical protein
MNTFLFCIDNDNVTNQVWEKKDKYLKIKNLVL